MNISTRVLQKYIACPESNIDLRHLLDDVGIEVKKVDGEIFSVELLANRGDHYCYAGIARELSGRLGQTVCYPNSSTLIVGENGPRVSIETDLCLVYTATYLEATAPKALSSVDLAPLEAAEIHSLGAPIDATNLSNIELGQPTHVFDADMIKGTIRVRLSTEGERAWPLFAEDKITLPVGTMVIADDEKVLAIAGVIGCEESKTTSTTRRIVLESACFDPVHVRKTSRATSIHTSSVARFERGSDPSFPIVGAGRVVSLLETCGWKRSGDSTLAGSWKNPSRVITLIPERANNFLETNIGIDEMMERLERYGCKCSLLEQSIAVLIPPHRLWDIEKVADLYEELAKSIGYNNTPISLPMIERGALPSLEQLRTEQVEEVLLGMGFFEVITDGFYGSGLLSQLQLAEDHPLLNHVSTLNALDRGYSLLKNNAFLHAVSAIAKNIKRHIFDIKIFEWTRYFVPDKSADNGICSEKPILWGAVCGKERPGLWTQDNHQADLYFVKGIVEELSNELLLPFVIVESDAKHPLFSSLHPYRQAEIMLRGKKVGIIGEVHPEIALRFKIKKQRPCYFEIDKASLFEDADDLQYKIPHAIQPLKRTISFALPKGFSAKKVQECIVPMCSSFSVVDLFAFEDNGLLWSSVTFELCFENPSGDLSADFVNNALQSLISLVSDRHGEEGVYQR
jgi:phenylalanyl-tRNA synthetase beta chain